MIIKWVGSLCIMVSCGGMGISLAYKQLRDLKLVEQFLRILERMESEIRYHLRPIPGLFRIVSQEEKGCLGNLFYRTAVELDNQIQPDVEQCLHIALCTVNIPDRVLALVKQLGRNLGRYDMQEQLLGIERIRVSAEEYRGELSRDKTKRIRGYQTLGLCAGAALVILFI